MKILVPDTIPLDLAELRDADAELDPVGYRVAEPVPEEHVDAEALVVWSQRPGAARRRGPAADAGCAGCRTSRPGRGSTLQAGFADEVVITSGRSLHDRTVAEHALALTLAAARHLHVAVRAQIGHRWASEIGGLQPHDNAQGFTTLRDATVVIWGFGGIARTLAPLYTALGARRGRRRPHPSCGRRLHASWTTSTPCSRRPTSSSTSCRPPRRRTGSLDARRLALLPRKAWLVNVGRGSTVDEDALVDALRAGGLAGAALDVTQHRAVARRLAALGPART